MKALIKKELSGYFASPLGYIYIAVMVLVSSYQFFMNVVLYGKTDMSAVYDIIFLLSFVLVPLLTMRTISEERRQGGARGRDEGRTPSPDHPLALPEKAPCRDRRACQGLPFG